MEKSSFKFLGYRVSEFSMEIKDGYFANPNLKNDLSIDLRNNFFKDNNRFVEISLGIKVKNEDEGFKLNLIIKGGFEADKEASEDLFKQLYNVNAPAILFPYARAIISSYTSQAGIPQVILPLINLSVFPKKESVE